MISLLCHAIIEIAYFPRSPYYLLGKWRERGLHGPQGRRASLNDLNYRTLTPLKIDFKLETKMNVLLIDPQINAWGYSAPTSIASFSLISLATYLNHHGRKTEILDMNASEVGEKRPVWEFGSH